LFPAQSNPMMIAHHKSFKSVSQNEKEATCVEVKFLFFEESQRRTEMLVCEELRFYFAKCVEVSFYFSKNLSEEQRCKFVKNSDFIFRRISTMKEMCQVMLMLPGRGLYKMSNDLNCEHLEENENEVHD
jgi:hypothetical protein